jgi:hypothetical protein
MMLPDEKIKCHHTAFTKKCRDMVVKNHCPKWVHIIGLDRNSGQPMDKFCCVDSILHTLLIENTQMNRETGAAVESTRNEYVRAADRNLEAMVQLHDTMVQAIAHQPFPGLLDVTPKHEALEDKSNGAA